ncbi:MAG: universal stress protein [Candidatus Thiodiazotropha sp. (ex Monitilora ramsayi)]|nr:universal stress protein [Candidatus Thiodiazotropha sp. (ex Monitilora ramsayi)]
MKRFKNILCVVDPLRVCKPTMIRAATLAKNNQAKLTVIDVVEPVTAGIGMPEGGPISENLQTVIVNDHRQKLEIELESYRKQIEIKTDVLVGTPFLEIIREVLRNERDLVIKATEHQHWLDRLFGSDDMHLLRKCPCPVWLIKRQAPSTHRCILAAVDAGEIYLPDEQKSRDILNRQILNMASSVALSDFAELHVVHVWDAVGESALRNSGFMMRQENEVTAYVEKVRQYHAACFDRLITEITTNFGQDAIDYLKPKVHLVKGWAREEVPVLASQIEADLIVMGTVARTGISGFFMGNTAETILNQIDCSVLAIKPPGFLTPVTLEA